MATRDEIKTYLGKRLGFAVTELSRASGVSACRLCGTAAAKIRGEGVGTAGVTHAYVCADFAGCEEREKAKVARNAELDKQFEAMLAEAEVPE